MPTIVEQWIYAIPIALVAFYACKFRWWLGLFPLIWTAMLIKGGTTLYLYDFSCESELYESTSSNVYFASLTVSAMLVLIAIFCGIHAGRKRARQNSSPDSDIYQEAMKS